MEYFTNTKNKEKLENIIKDWIGVPYLHMGDSKAGVDCAKFIGKVLVELGIISQIEPRIYYAKDWYIHSEREFVLESIANNLAKYLNEKYIINRFKIEDQEKYKPKFGDVLGFSTSPKGLTNHVSFMLNEPYMVHCLHKNGVGKSSYNRNWKKQITYYYRIYEV